MVNINAEAGVEKNTTTGVANGYVDDCGPGRHTFSQYVVDTEHVYDVCTCCGYTLIHVMDESGIEIKQTQNTLDANGDVVENGEVVTPVETYLTTATIPTKIVDEKTVVDVDNLSKANINTDGNSGKPIEESPVVVSKDEDGKVISIDRTCNHEFTYSDYLHDTDDICLGTCKYCNLKIHTKHDWWVKTQLPGQTEYAGICSKCGCLRDTSVAQIVGGAKYQTLPEAFAAVHNGSEKTVTIKMLSDEKYEIVSSAVTVLAGEKITIDLNGHTLSGYANQAATSYMITNRGELVFKDSGTNGKFISTINGADGNDYPAYACGTVSNIGKFTLESGILESKSSGGCAYVIDTSYGATSIDINGGKVIGTGNDAVIRLYSTSSTSKVTLNINSGEIISNGCGDTAIFIQMSDGCWSETNFNGGSITNNNGKGVWGIGQCNTDFSKCYVNFNGTDFIGGDGYLRSLSSGYAVLEFPTEGSPNYPHITVSNVYTKKVFESGSDSTHPYTYYNYWWRLTK